MSQHKKRKHPHLPPPPKPPGDKIYYRIIPVAVIIFITFGTGIAYFAGASDISWLIFGGFIGAAFGFLFGYQVAKGLSKK